MYGSAEERGQWTALAFVFLVVHCRVVIGVSAIDRLLLRLPLDLNRFAQVGQRHLIMGCDRGREGSLDPNLVEDGDLFKRGAADFCIVRRGWRCVGKGAMSGLWSEHMQRCAPHMQRTRFLSA